MAKPAKTKAVFDYLKKCASQMRTVSYLELAKATSVATVGIGDQLGYIRDACRAKGLPWLNAIAVKPGTWRPGEGFLPEGVALGSDEERVWRGMVLQVFAFDWDRIKL